MKVIHFKHSQVLLKSEIIQVNSKTLLQILHIITAMSFMQNKSMVWSPTRIFSYPGVQVFFNST